MTYDDWIRLGGTPAVRTHEGWQRPMRDPVAFRAAQAAKRAARTLPRVRSRAEERAALEIMAQLNARLRELG